MPETSYPDTKPFVHATLKGSPMTDTSVTVSIQINRLTRAETAAAIDAAPHGSALHIDVIHPDDRRAGWRYDIRADQLTMTGGRDLIAAVHQHMDDVAAGEPPARGATA